MAIEHDSIADGERHEPKGISTAALDEVYAADGAGGGTWKSLDETLTSGATAKQIFVADGAGSSSWEDSVRMGWQDYNDVATATTPIILSSAGTWFNITNDGAGTFTNTAYRIPGAIDTWNTSTNRFDWSGLDLGDVVILRWDLEFTTSGIDHEINVRIRLAEGHADQYELPLSRDAYKTAGTYRETRTTQIYMGDLPTRDNPGVLQVMSDTGTSDTVKVNGWVATVIKRGSF